MTVLGMDADLKSRGLRFACVVAAGGALVLAVAVLAATPASAGAAIEIHPATGETGTPLGTIKKGKCRLEGPKGDKVLADKGKSTDRAFELIVSINQWEGFRDTYQLFFGSEQPANFALVGPGGPYSNLNPIPGTPPGVVAGGAIAFEKKGKRMSFGFFGAPNQDFSQGVSITGAMKCKYPKKK
ncbi:MAG: hypothetical protein ACRDL3_12670 [Solirubrobacterales bacterium]